MIARRTSQTSEVERLPKNFPALQERMETVKRGSVDKQHRSPIENMTSVEKDETFFLL